MAVSTTQRLNVAAFLVLLNMSTCLTMNLIHNPVEKQENIEIMDRQTSCGWKPWGASLLESETWSDCEFTVGKQATLLKAHRLVLASASPIFAKMLYGPLAERQFIVRIPDIELDVFHSLLEYMYTDAVTSVPIELVDDLMYASRKYLMPGLVRACGDALQSRVTAENATWIYELATKLQHHPLIDRCLEIFSKQTQEVLPSPGLEKARVDTLAVIFSQQSLNIESELELLAAMERYAYANGLIQKEMLNVQDEEETLQQKTAIMQPLWQHIRLLSLPPSKWAAAQQILRLFLSKDELMAVVLNAVSPGAVLLPKGFSTNRVQRTQEVPFMVALPTIGINSEMTIELQGIVHKNAKRFDINLQYGEDAPITDRAYWIPLHLSVRFNEGCIVRNTVQNTGLGPEERQGGLPLHPGMPFNMTISWDNEEYTVVIDGSEFCTYKHRMPPTAITHFGMWGDVEVTALSVQLNVNQ